MVTMSTMPNWTSAPISTIPPSLVMNCCGGTLKFKKRKING
jgi:hypothetical protein